MVCSAWVVFQGKNSAVTVWMVLGSWFYQVTFGPTLAVTVFGAKAKPAMRTPPPLPPAVPPPVVADWPP